MSLNAPHSAPLNFTEFWFALAEAMRLDANAVEPTATLREELGLDSLQMVELVLALEDFGIVLDEDSIPKLLTTQDLYDYYCSSVEAAAHD